MFTENPRGAVTRKVLSENILFLEVFAGTSSLAIEVRKTNPRGVAVYKGTEKEKGPITILGLTKPTSEVERCWNNSATAAAFRTISNGTPRDYRLTYLVQGITLTSHGHQL